MLLEIRDWTVAHPADPHRVVVDRANLTVRRGEIVGLAGLMGAGRTELARSVFGQSYGTKRSGTLLKDGKEIHGEERAARPSTPASPTSPRTARRSA